MRLNFELNVLIRDQERASELETALCQDFERDSTEIDLKKFQRRSFGERFIESALRPLAPLL